MYHLMALFDKRTTDNLFATTSHYPGYFYGCWFDHTKLFLVCNTITPQL